MTADVDVVDLAARPDLRRAADALVAENLPEFMTWASPGNWRWHRIYDLFADHQLCALDASGELVGAAHGLPLAWDGTPSGLPAGYDDVLVRVVDSGGAAPTATCLLSVSVSAAARRRGIANILIAEAHRRAAARGRIGVVVPLRPTHKTLHPEVPLESYVEWVDDDGEPYDPWLRTHTRLGAEVLAIAPRSLVIAEPAARWEAVAGRSMPAPGAYLLDGALAPVEVDAAGVGTYAEPNVWICHWCPAQAEPA